MSYENDPYRDEGGEPLMDYDDDMNNDHEPDQHQNNFLDDYDGDENNDGWNQERTTSTPVHDEYRSKPRKRLIKKSSAGRESVQTDFGMRDEEEGDDDVAALVRNEWEEDGGGPSSSSGGGGGVGKRKRLGKESEGERRKKEKGREGKGEKKFKARKAGYSGVGGGRSRDHEGDREMKEMWDTVAGGDSEVCS